MKDHFFISKPALYWIAECQCLGPRNHAQPLLPPQFLHLRHQSQPQKDEARKCASMAGDLIYLKWACNAI